jgi:ribonuclease VapC
VILDSSAIVAIVHREPGFETIAAKIGAASAVGIGTPTLLEAGIVIEARLGVDAQSLLDRFMADFEVTRVPFGEQHGREALRAFRRFGRGRHPAALNFGDCMAYATARLAGEPLLYVGEDFSRTDITPA